MCSGFQQCYKYFDLSMVSKNQLASPRSAFRNFYHPHFSLQKILRPPPQTLLPESKNTSQNPKTLPRIQKHFPESKTLPRIQNTFQNPKTRLRLQNTSQNPKTRPRIQNTSQNPKHFPESKNTSQNPKHVPEPRYQKYTLYSSSFIARIQGGFSLG